MTVIAKVIANGDWGFVVNSVHAAPKTTAHKIAAQLNERGYDLNRDWDESWAVLDLDREDSAARFARAQSFRMCKGVATEYNSLVYSLE